MDPFLVRLKDSVTADGVISEEEVATLKGVLSKQGMNEETLSVLLAINTTLSGSKYPKSFEDLFVRSIFAYMLGTGNRIQDDRWAWLKENLLKDGVIDALERRLLLMIKQQSRQYPPELDELLSR